MPSPIIRLTRLDGSYKTLEEIEREVIRRYVNLFRKPLVAARVLGVCEKTVYNKLKK